MCKIDDFTVFLKRFADSAVLANVGMGADDTQTQQSQTREANQTTTETKRGQRIRLGHSTCGRN